MESTELMHYGVKGMKWGVRRARKSSGGLTDRQIKKYAKKGYAQDSFRSNKTMAGKAWDAYTGAHKTQAGIKYDMSSKKQNRERAEKYLADKKNARSKSAKNLKKRAAKGATAIAGTLAKVGQAYVTDQLFFGGYGTTAVKETLRAMGMVSISAYYKYAKGATDIHWYTKDGRKIV